MDEIIVAGFGGQGVLVLGQVIAYASMIENKSVSWFPLMVQNSEEERVTVLL